MLSDSPPRLAAAAAGDAVVLPSSPDDDSHPSMIRLTPTQVAKWTLKDVENHIFFVVWVCGIPVHVQYIVHLLEHSTVSTGRGREQTPHARSTRESLIAMAQADVLEPVCRRAAGLRHVLSRWPITATLPDPRSHEPSELVSLGVLSVAPEHEGCEIRPTERGECDEDGGSVKATASSSSSCFAIQAGAVTPAERFVNVAALALCSPAERECASLSSKPSATWCAQAYWTAVDQAQQWIAGWPSSSSGAARDTDSLGGTGAMPDSAWPHLQPECAWTSSRGKRPRGCDAPDTDDVVVVDEDEGEPRHNAGGAGLTSRAASDALHRSKASRCEMAEVVVIDSDEDDL
ncbi:hypothetical protein LSCM4_06825 [Leishmania orientalis]|uniref:Uncharacterized protein n=1 Tax=Leishmania orientalis TaxID=2249476 RepID=A0A836GQ47_9TRYP|nr:hypothetical protein LSCM4_06825 [Leishmania orientalis]